MAENLRTELRRRNPASAKAIALAMIALFCFQISRVYLVDQVDAFYSCPYTQVWTSNTSDEIEAEADAVADAASDAKIFQAFSASDSDGQPTVRSCKNTLDGLGLSPTQPMGTPALIPQLSPGTKWAQLSASEPSAPETDPSPHFQPPRPLSS